MLAWLLGPALAAPLTVDWTGLARPSVRPNAPTCPTSGTHVLGAALVTYSRKSGLSAWGHSSLRFWVCEDGAFADREYEAYRLSKNEARLLRERHPELDPDHLRDQAGKLVVFRNEDPVDSGEYGKMQARNRDILELWLDPSLTDLDALYATTESDWQAQMRALRSGGRLAERYRGLGPNCTAILRPLPHDGAPITPFAWFRRYEDRAIAVVMHPGHHRARQLIRRGELRVTPRRKTVFRGARRLPDAVVRKLRAQDPALWVPAPLDWLEPSYDPRALTRSR